MQRNSEVLFDGIIQSEINNASRHDLINIRPLSYQKSFSRVHQFVWSVMLKWNVTSHANGPCSADRRGP